MLTAYDAVLADRKYKYDLYKEKLQGGDGLGFQTLKIGEPNYSYFPILFRSEKELLRVEEHLKQNNVYPRRYFWPSVNTYTRILEYERKEVSEDIASRVLCLPLFCKEAVEDVLFISEPIRDIKH